MEYTSVLRYETVEMYRSFLLFEFSYHLHTNICCIHWGVTLTSFLFLFFVCFFLHKQTEDLPIAPRFMMCRRMKAIVRVTVP